MGGHDPANPVVVHAHHPPAPYRGVSVGFLHQLPTRHVLHAGHMAGGVFLGRANIEHE